MMFIYIVEASRRPHDDADIFLNKLRHRRPTKPSGNIHIKREYNCFRDT